MDEDFDFADYKNNDISCAKCGDSLGAINSSDANAFQITVLCDSCLGELEDDYKQAHPEEYD